MIRIPRSIAALAWCLSAASPASAIESFAGTYEGKITCREVGPTGVDRSKQDVVIGVSGDRIGGPDDPENEVLLVLLGAPITGAVRAIFVPSAVDPTRARLAGGECTLTFFNLSGGAVQADVVVKRAGGKAALKGTLIDVDEEGSRIATCSFAAKRVATDPLEIPGCL